MLSQHVLSQSWHVPSRRASKRFAVVRSFIGCESNARVRSVGRARGYSDCDVARGAEVKNATLIQERLVTAESTQDSSEETAAWLKLRTLRAEIQPAGDGSEIFAQNEMKPIQSFRITTEYVKDISAGDRLVDRWGGEIYHVTAAKNGESRKRKTLIRAKEWQS